MKVISKVFTKDGFTFRQIRRVGDLALYCKRKDGAGGMIQSFEVIKVQQARKRETLPSGSIIEPGDESYPSSSNWGIAGWSYQTEEHAHKAFEYRLKGLNPYQAMANQAF